MTVAAIIPTLAEAPQLWTLLDVLDREPDTTTIVVDNGMPTEARICVARHRAVVLDAPGMSIHRMWNLAADRAHLLAEEAHDTVPHLAFLNDDITILPGTLAALGAVLDRDPGVWIVSADYRRRTAEGLHPAGHELVHGTYRHGGICGWCFMVRAGCWPGVDETLQWWYGDDDIVFTLEQQGGKAAIALGVPVDHEHEGTARHHPWTLEARVVDAATFAAKWGDR